MKLAIERKCRDYGEGKPGCLGEIDPRYTMDFTDVEPGPDGFIYWCSACGPGAHAMNDALSKALAERGPEFAADLDAAIEEAHTNAARRRS